MSQAAAGWLGASMGNRRLLFCGSLAVTIHAVILIALVIGPGIFNSSEVFAPVYTVDLVGDPGLPPPPFAAEKAAEKPAPAKAKAVTLPKPKPEVKAPGPAELIPAGKDKTVTATKAEISEKMGTPKENSSPQPAPGPTQIELAGLNLEINPQPASGLPLEPAQASPLPPAELETSQWGGVGSFLLAGSSSGKGGRWVDEEPQVIRQVQPVYPFLARRRGISGQVVVRFLVDVEGRVDKLSFVRAEPPGVFEESVRQAVSLWRFTPGLYQGRPVPTWVVLPIKFRLEG